MKPCSSNTTKLIFSSLLLGASLIPVSNAVAQSIVTQWNDAAIEAVKATNFAPTKTARALAITNTCMYDAWAPYSKHANGTQLTNKLRQPISERTNQNKIEAMSYAAHTCLTDLFPNVAQQTIFNDLLTSLGFDPNNSSTDTSTPAGIGHVTATAVLNFRHHDGSNQLGDEVSKQCTVDATIPYSDYTCYQPINTISQLIDPNHWQPLLGQIFLTPHWGLVTPYALSSGDQLRDTLLLPADYALNTARYEKQAAEIIDITANLSDKQKIIAEYWANGPNSVTPPGHWILFAKYVSNSHQHNLNQDVKMFFAMTNAMFDAGISVWDAKRYFDYVRPISAIRFLYKGLSIESWNGLVKGEDWSPYQPSNALTPPFAEYVSGHSAFSASAAETLRLFTGSDEFNNEVTIPAGSSIVEPGIVPHDPITLSWSTFTDAANEAGMSRRYGGIHFKDGDLESRKLGRKIAAIAWSKSLSYFHPVDDTENNDD